MELESRTKQIIPPFFAQPHHHPTPASTPHHFSCGRSSGLCNSLDTPLSFYVANRSKLRTVTVENSHTVQVPLSALSPAKVQPGAVGGSFNSTSRIKSVPLPTLYNQYQASRRGVRNVSLHSHRYTPSTRHTRTVSDSLLVLPQLVSRQKGHLAEHRKTLQRTQSLKTESQVVPHRVEKAFYMSGHMAHLFDREEIPQEEVRTLETVTLSQNPSLYYGKGIKSCRIQSKAVQRFENKLKEVGQISQHYDLEAVNFDAGRYSRASRGITPSSPIPEEDVTKEEEKEEEEERRKTFMTESQRKLKTDNRNL